VSSVIVERQQTQQRATRLHADGPWSDATNNITDRFRTFSLSDEIISRFRQPMTPGETRQNIAFGADCDHEIND